MKTDEKIFRELIEIANIKGNIAKKELLKKYDSPEMRETLRFLLDSMFVSGISEKKLSKDCRSATTSNVKKFSELMEYIRDYNSGRDRDVAVVQQYADTLPEDVRPVVYKIIAQKYSELGIGVTFANQVFGEDFIKEFAVMLADKYFDDPEYWNGKLFGIQTKLDGKRTVVIKRNGKISVFARSGKDLTGEFPEIEQAARDIELDNFVLDGERVPVGFKKLSSKDSFKAVSSDSKKGQKTGLCLAVYDFMKLDQWDKRECTDCYQFRYDAYHALLKDHSEFLQPLELAYVGRDTKVIVNFLEEAKTNKQEGVMVKDMEGLYVWDRCKEIVKVKSFFDIDVVIEGFDYGTGKNKDRCGSLYFTYKGCKVNVGSGLTDAMRDDIVKNPKNWIGKTAEIVYFEETSNKAGGVSLRFPTFKCLKDGT